MDVEAETPKIEGRLTYTEGFLQSVLKKLNNERFYRMQNLKSWKRNARNRLTLKAKLLC
jgi:hypothetical protein